MKHTDKDATPAHDELVFEAVKYFKRLYKGRDISFEYERPVDTLGYRSPMIIGYIDLVIYVRSTKTKEGATIYLEVKPEINSFGNLVRQIQTYRKYRNSRERGWVYYKVDVYSHDQRFREQLLTQGITMYPPASEKVPKGKRKF